MLISLFTIKFNDNEKIILIVFLIYSFFGLFAQQSCPVGSDPLLLGFDCEPSDFEDFQDEYMAYLMNQIDNRPYKIPVVFHILEKTNGNLITDEEITDELNAVNSVYQNVYTDQGITEIEFYLANKDESGDCFSGIVRHDVGN